MTSNEVFQTLKKISTMEKTINENVSKDLNVKETCLISANSIKAWHTVMHEFNDVISTLANSEKNEDRIYRGAFCKALQIVMLANNNKRRAKE